MSHQPSLGGAAKNLQQSFKILSLLDGSSSLNQALQLSQSGGNILMKAPAGRGDSTNAKIGAGLTIEELENAVALEGEKRSLSYSGMTNNEDKE